jgi:hypothetical protein
VTCTQCESIIALCRYSSGGALTAFGLFPIIAELLRPNAAFVLFADGVYCREAQGKY